MVSILTPNDILVREIPSVFSVPHEQKGRLGYLAQRSFWGFALLSFPRRYVINQGFSQRVKLWNRPKKSWSLIWGKSRRQENLLTKLPASICNHSGIPANNSWEGCSDPCPGFDGCEEAQGRKQSWDNESMATERGAWQSREKQRFPKNATPDHEDALGVGRLCCRWSWQVSSPEGNSHAGARLTCEQQITGLAKLERHQFFFTSNFAIIAWLRLEFCVPKQSEKLPF